jgi:amino acid transporter
MVVRLDWHLAVILTLVSGRGAVRRCANFIDGPRVLSNMATDSWMPHRFAHLSERLVTKNGVVLMAVASACLMVYSRGRVSYLVVLYAINVFITFSLTQLGMARMFIAERQRERRWAAKFSLHVLTLVLCVAILVITTYEKLAEGGWLTFTITSALIALCLMVHRHYRSVQRRSQRTGSTQIRPRAGRGAVEVDPMPRRHPVRLRLRGSHSRMLSLETFPNYRTWFSFQLAWWIRATSRRAEVDAGRQHEWPAAT